jgi:opacity protein-like surface antigen
MRQDTKAPTNYYNTVDKNGDFDIGINWILLGFNRYQRFENEKIEGFGGLGLGVAIFDVSSPEGRSESSTKFGWNLKLGVNIYASEKFAIKLQTGLMSAVQELEAGCILALVAPARE